MTFSRGLSLVGLLLGIAVGGILLIALVLFITRGFGVSREHTEQVRITEDARIQMEHMSDAIRDARSVDTNGDTLATLPEERWLQHGDDFDIQFLTNFDTDADLERLHYFLEGTELKLGMRDPYTVPAEQENVTVVAKSLRNVAESLPLLRYYSATGDVAMTTPIVAADAVKRVEIMLLVDVSEQQDPPAATVSTIVAPRASDVVLALPSPSPSPPP